MTFIRFFLILLILLSASSIQAEKIRFLVSYEDIEQEPYAVGNGQSIPEKPGITIEMILMLKDYLPDLSIEFRRTPWKRCLKELSSGKVDAVFIASYKPDRLKMGAYPMQKGLVDKSRRLATITYSFYKIKGTRFGWNGKRIKNFYSGKVGAPTGYSIVSDLRKLNIPVKEARSTYQNFQKLITNRVELVATQIISAEPVIKRNPEFRDIVKINPSIISKEYYMMISHQFVQSHPQLSEKIWDTLAEIREKKIDALAIKYMNKHPVNDGPIQTHKYLQYTRLMLS